MSEQIDISSLNRPPQVYHQPEMAQYQYNSTGNSDNNNFGRQSPPPANHDTENNNNYNIAAPGPYYQPNSSSARSSTTSLDSNDPLFENNGSHRGSDTGAGGAGGAAVQNYGSTTSGNVDDNGGDFLDMEDTGKRSKFKRYFRNRKKACCFICCGVFIIVAVIMIPLSILVIAPAIAQDAVTHSKISFDSANLTHLQEDSFLMKFKGKVTDTGPMAATIEVPGGVEVSWNGTVLGRLPLDTISAAPFVGADIDSAQTFNITNKTAFGIFNKYMLSANEFTWHMEGSANVQAVGLKLKNIQLSKDVTMNGMKNFPDVSIKSFDAPSDHPLGGIAIEIVSILVNPSPIGVELGDLDFEVLYNNQTVGDVTATGVTLGRGANTLNLNGRLIPQNSSDGLAAVSDMFSKYISGDNSNTSVVAKSARPNNESAPISWLQSAFVGTSLSVVLQGGQNISVINSVNLGTMDLTFSVDHPYNPIASSDSLEASFKIPFGFLLTIKQISQNITIYGGSNALATLSSPYTDAHGDSSVGKIDSTIPPTSFDVVSGSESAFDDFSKHLTTDSSVGMTLKGTANSMANTSIGNVEINGIKFTADTSLQGLQGLSSKPVTIGSLSVVGGTSDHMIIKLSVTLFNPSNVKIAMGDVELDLYYQNNAVGQVLMNNFTLDRGSNTVQVITYFGPKGDQAIAAGRNLLNSFMKGANNTVDIKGTTGSTPIASLKQALASLQFTTTMPGLPQDKPVLQGSLFSVNPLTVLFTKQGTAAVIAYNPLDTKISFLHIKATIDHDGQTIGNLDQDLSSNPIVIPSKQAVTSRDMLFNLQLSWTAIQSLFAGISGSLATDITSTITLSIGDYVTTLDYSQSGVPTSLGHGQN